MTCARCERLEGLLRKVADGLWNVEYPDPTGKSGREWRGEFSTYLRGSAMAMLELEPDEMRDLQRYTTTNAALAAEPEPPCEVCGHTGWHQCKPKCEVCGDGSGEYTAIDGNTYPCHKCKPPCEVCGGSGRYCDVVAGIYTCPACGGGK